MTYSRPWPWPWGLSANSKKVPQDIWWQLIKTSSYTLPGPDNTLKWIFSIFAFNTTWKFTERHKKKNDILSSRLSLNPYKTQPSSLCYCSQINISSQSLKFLSRLQPHGFKCGESFWFGYSDMTWNPAHAQSLMSTYQKAWLKGQRKHPKNPCSVSYFFSYQLPFHTLQLCFFWIIGFLLCFFEIIESYWVASTLLPTTLIQTLTRSLHPFFINSDTITSWNTSTLNQMLITLYSTNGAAA